MSRIRPTTSSWSSSGTSRFTSVNQELEVRCHCDIKLNVKTSSTRTNPGRRFLSCPIRGIHKCDYFVWIDPELPTRTVELYQALLDRTKLYEREVESYKMQPFSKFYVSFYFNE
ncbi:hypothetical protein ACS0TY_006677 [Phlomoides rotata]